ncbi:malonate decarboxylase holo-ACP synthase [Companilactobacillus farciminis]|nr:malonate decarboxylase holo-ACP synthase [Companilactobacillus farciminis]
MVKVEPHDLLKISSINDLITDGLPKWAQDIFPDSLTVVVRRSEIVDAKIPVGIRGIKREQRFAAFVLDSNVKEVITPYQLVSEESWKNISDERKMLPAVKALPAVAKILQEYKWGISGSVGFELATGTNSAKMTSDLDLVWKPNSPIIRKDAKSLLKKLNQFGVHADLQVIQGNNGFSLEEYSQSKSTIMMKTLSDPILVKDPWNK